MKFDFSIRIASYINKSKKADTRRGEKVNLNDTALAESALFRFIPGFIGMLLHIARSRYFIQRFAGPPMCAHLFRKRLI